MLNDQLANVLSAINHHEQLGRKTLVTQHNSKFIREILKLLNSNGYLGEATEVDDGKGKWLSIPLIGSINKINVIKPRFSVKRGAYEKFETLFLPAKAMGIIIVSTSKGIMTHSDAKAKGLGGRLICYCY